MNPFLHPEQRRRFLTAKTRELIAACGGIEAAADITGRTKSTVGRWQDFESGDSAPMECIAAMQAATGTTIVTAAIGQHLASRAYAPARTHAPARAREACAEAFADLNHRAGVLNAELVLALQDGEVTAGEAQALSKVSGQVRQTLDRIERALHAAVTPRAVVQDGEAS